MTESDWVVADSIYGKIVVNRHDFRGQAILRTGIPPGNASIVLLCDILKRRGEQMGWQGRSQSHDGRGPVVIDVGANCGSYALAMKRYAESVTAIEPQPELFAALRRTVMEVNEDLGCIWPLPCAVGRGDRLLHIPDIDRSQYHVSDLVKLEPARPDMRHRLIRETTIDRIVEFMRLDRVDLLKIDTEGMEIDVIEGARETIAKHKPVLFVEFLHCDRFTLQAMLFDLGYPSIQVVEDNDFLCDPDVPFTVQHSYGRHHLPSLHSPEALWTMSQLALGSPKDGAFVEVGIYRGGSAERLCAVSGVAQRRVILYDTVRGLPAPVHELDKPMTEGQWALTQGDLWAIEAKLGALAGERLAIHPHCFPREDVLNVPARVAFAHIDCGTYQSTKDSMEALWPRMVSGGIMLMGDYGYPGSKLAADTTAYSLVPKPTITMTAEKRLVLTKP